MNRSQVNAILYNNDLQEDQSLRSLSQPTQVKNIQYK